MNKERVKELEDFAEDFNKRLEQAFERFNNNVLLYITKQEKEEIEKTKHSLSQTQLSTLSSKKKKQTFVIKISINNLIVENNIQRTRTMETDSCI